MKNQNAELITKHIKHLSVRTTKMLVPECSPTLTKPNLPKQEKPSDSGTSPSRPQRNVFLKCISQNVFLKMYFSTCISQNVFPLPEVFLVFPQTYKLTSHSKCIPQNVFLKMYFSKCISPSSQASPLQRQWRVTVAGRSPLRYQRKGLLANDTIFKGKFARNNC